MVGTTAEHKSKKLPKQERASLDEQSATRIDRWLEQVVQQVPGIKIGRSEIVRWLVTSRPEQLTGEELQQIKDQYFDEMEFALWMIRQLKDSRARGEKLSLSDLLGDVNTVRPAKKPRRKAALGAALAGAEVNVE